MIFFMSWLIDRLFAWFVNWLVKLQFDHRQYNTSMFRETLLAANAIYTDLYANPDGSLPVNSNNKNKNTIFF